MTSASNLCSSTSSIFREIQPIFMYRSHTRQKAGGNNEKVNLPEYAALSKMQATRWVRPVALQQRRARQKLNVTLSRSSQISRVSAYLGDNKAGGDFPRAVVLITSLCSYATVSRATPYRNSNISG